MCSSIIHDRIRNWRVSTENFDSDHQAILYEIYSSREDKEGQEENLESEEGIKWARPSQKMIEIMKRVLPKMVCFRRRMGGKEDVEMFVQRHTQEIQMALTKLFSTNKEVKRPCYWWSKKVSEVHSVMKKAKKRYQRYKYEDMLKEYNEARRNFREEVKRAKINAWQEYTSNIDDLWKGLIKVLKRQDGNRSQNRTLRNISGVYSRDMQSTLSMLNKQFYPEVAEYTEEQIKIEESVAERLERTETGEKITICEFRKAISEMKKAKAPGADKITNCVLHILANECKFEKQYIDMYNVCISKGYFPDEWKEAKIVLIPKHIEVLDSVKAYRPISLTSVFSKLLERIVLARILFHIELSGNLTISQHAYRKRASTTMVLYEVTKFVQDTLYDKNVCVIVFLDISGAFDRTWHGGILNRLLQYNVPAYLVKWVRLFLKERSAYFEAAEEKCEVTLEQGCPQGGVLSPVLWNVMFNDMLVMKLKVDQNFHFKTVGYADDAAVLCRAKDVKSASVILTNYLIRISEWAKRNRVQFNQGKLRVLVVNRGFVTAPASVYFEGKLICEVEQYKYLGVIIDKRLSWRPHADSVIEKLNKLTRMLRGVIREKWGVRMAIMRMLFKTIFCPIMMYGVVIWGWKMMNNMMCMRFNSVIRRFCVMSTRCFKSTSSEMLFRMMQTANFSTLVRSEVVKVSLLQLHLARSDSDRVFGRESMRGRSRPISMEHFIYMCKQELDAESLDVVYEDLLHNYSVSPTEWEITHTCVKERRSALWDSVNMAGVKVYTDASVSSYGAGCAFMVFQQGLCIKSQGFSLNKCSIFTAEVNGILYALKYVGNDLKNLRDKEEVDILCDSQAVIHAIERTVIVDPVVRELIEELRNVAKNGVKIVIKWIPSHAGVGGNEGADRMANIAVDSYEGRSTNWVKWDLRARIKTKTAKDISKDWNNLGTKIPKLFFPDVGSFNLFLRSSPSVDLYQLVTGHCRLNDFMCNKMSVIETAMCACNEEEETVFHFLCKCSLYDHIRSEIWKNFEPTYEFIRRDWGKVNEYINKTRRFVKIE